MWGFLQAPGTPKRAKKKAEATPSASLRQSRSIPTELFNEGYQLLNLKHAYKLHFPLNALVYMFDETPAIIPPMTSSKIGLNFLSIPGFTLSNRTCSKTPLVPAM